MSSPGAALPAPGGQISRGHSRSREERILWAVVGAALLLLAVAVRGDGQATAMLGAIVVGLVLVSYQRVLLAWQTMLGLILLIILFIPIRRYTVGGSLPIELEPYRHRHRGGARLLVLRAGRRPEASAGAAPGSKRRWPRCWWRMLLSLAANIGSVNAHSDVVIKNFTFFLSYLLVVYFIASIVRSREAVDRMLRLLVGGGTIVAFLSLVEWKTGTNFFNWYSHALPFLHYVDEGVASSGGTRHPRPRLRPAPDRAQRGAGDAHAARRVPVQRIASSLWLGLRGDPHARRALDRIADGHDDADRAARHASSASSRARRCGCCRCCSRC